MAGERILLVDDAAEVRQFLADSVLRAEGYDVLTAANGVEGYTLARDLRPDLIIADYLMPKWTGLEMLAALRQDSIDLPFILITAEGSEEMAVQALRLGVNDYMIKPFNPDDLLSAMQRVLREHWTRQITRQIPAQLMETNLQLEQRLHELDTLVQIGKRVTSLLDLQEVLNQIVQAAVRLAKVERGNLLLVDEQSGELYLYASSEKLNETSDSFRLPVADSLAGQVVKTGDPLVISGDALHKIKTHYLVRDVMYIPLLLRGQVIGVLEVSNQDISRAFEPHALQLLRVLADFSAIAIGNARLYATVQHERDTLDAILRDTEDVIVVTDTQDNILFCNPSAQRTFDIERDDFIGQPLTEVIRHAEVQDLFQKDPSTRRSLSSEIRLDEDGRYLNAQLSQVELVGKVAVMQDITHLKELDRIKGDFVTAVSHDLRSPLTAILGYVELLSRVGPLNDNQREFVGRIHASVESIASLITDLLELGKIEAGFDKDRELAHMDTIVRDAVEGQRHQWEAKHHHIDVTVPGTLPPVLGYPPRLKQLTNNLVENAIKYTPENGDIRVSIEQNGDFLVLRVEDTGIGIPKKDQPYIFDKFYRTDQAIDHFSGTGLGLSIVKSIVEQHAGRIWVDSRSGVGSTFSVMLPACLDDPCQGEPQPQGHAAR
ncbi:ATP-binding protein [Aggregatilinea lenta]|uniref:ATP-binding protein n=1 Tax=Aggregatilinea lenta TaxID=913108 RepID=UPI000E5BB374|nr:ATP-binding protein [Aggregatilinea lenta]